MHVIQNGRGNLKNFVLFPVGNIASATDPEGGFALQEDKLSDPSSIVVKL